MRNCIQLVDVWIEQNWKYLEFSADLVQLSLFRITKGELYFM